MLKCRQGFIWLFDEGGSFICVQPIDLLSCPIDLLSCRSLLRPVHLYVSFYRVYVVVGGGDFVVLCYLFVVFTSILCI